MYDTLMQMGRWFGFSDGYLDVCRLYTAAELLEWFTHIAAASEELQREFQHMVNVGGHRRIMVSGMRSPGHARYLCC